MYQEQNLEFRNVPKGYQLCFNKECAKKEECLRFMVGREVPDNRDWGPAVYPNVKKDEKGCRFLENGEPQLMAWGFNTLFSEVKHKDIKHLRTTLKQYLGGHSNYYRYHNGERLLDPQQQRWIIDFFRRTGYNENLEFDHEVKAYVFV